MFLAPAEAHAQGGARLTLPGSFVCLTAVPHPGAMHRRDRVLGFVVIVSILGTARLCQMHGGGRGWPAGTSGAPCLSPFKETSKRSAGDFCPIWDQSHRSPSYAPKHKTRLGGAMLRLWVETKHYQSRSSLSPGTLITHLLGEQSRYKHGDRPNLAVQLLWVGPLWGPRHTPPTT